MKNKIKIDYSITNSTMRDMAYKSFKDDYIRLNSKSDDRTLLFTAYLISRYSKVINTMYITQEEAYITLNVNTLKDYYAILEVFNNNTITSKEHHELKKILDYLEKVKIEGLHTYLDNILSLKSKQHIQTTIGYLVDFIDDYFDVVDININD